MRLVALCLDSTLLRTLMQVGALALHCIHPQEAMKKRASDPLLFF